MTRRANAPVTDLKWNTKKRLLSMREKLHQISYNWGDLDFIMVQHCDDIIAKIDDMLEEMQGIEPGKF